MTRSINDILRISISSCPFVYLGVLISHKRLALAHFQFMIDKVNRSVGGWSRSRISKAGRVVLINSFLLATLVYYLSVYPVPDSVLDKTSKCARRFL